MSRLFLPLLFVLLLCTCGRAQNDQTLQLSFRSMTDTLYPTVESVTYDPVSNFIFTANINGHFLARDGNGSIGRLSPEGNTQTPEWVTGLDAPTGLCVVGGQLYTTDINRLISIEIATGEITKVTPIPGAKALNDITADPAGNLYLSDTGGDQIFIVRDGKPDVYLANIKTPNGLEFADGVLFATLWTPRELVVINANKKIYRWATDLPQGDGLQQLPNGDFLISSWSGGVYHLTTPRYWRGRSARSGAITKLLDLQLEGVKSPDVCYLPELDLLVVPTFDGDRLRFYQAQPRSNATAPYPISPQALSGHGLRRVTNPADPEREMYQQQQWQGEELAVYLIATETKTASYDDHPIDEYLRVLDGRARLRPTGQNDRFYPAGQHFLVPRGYRGDWETQGGHGRYLELSVVARGDTAFAPDSLQPMAFALSDLIGAPPHGRTSQTILRGTKLAVTLTADTLTTYALNTDKEQLIEVLDGVVRLSQRGDNWTFRKGDIFVLPRSFQGRWSRVGKRSPRCLRVTRRRS